MSTKKLPKHRAHRILFDADLPFRSRRIKPKNQFRRKPKHMYRSEL